MNATPDSVTAYVTRRIVIERESGRSYAEIADDLTTARFRAPSGRPFTASTVRRLYTASQREQVA